jgi:thymidylate synthase (FAD)
MRVDVLDHGYVALIERWGRGSAQPLGTHQDCEAGIIEAARQSTQGSFRGWDTDAKLLKYLYEHKHATPFEFAGMVIEVRAPIFVFREWHRHRTQSYNEMSARYAPLPDLYYLPDPANVLERARVVTQNRQAAGLGPMDEDAVAWWLRVVACQYEDAERAYQTALVAGVPKELARIVMPVGHYTQMRASANLRNWLTFLTLRLDPNAQWEIRQYANAVGKCIAEFFPQTWDLFSAP